MNVYDLTTAAHEYREALEAVERAYRTLNAVSPDDYRSDAYRDAMRACNAADIAAYETRARLLHAARMGFRPTLVDGTVLPV